MASSFSFSIKIFSSIISIVFLGIFSWVLIHLFGLFGVFLAIAYPIWWLLLPDKVPCLLCRIHQNGRHCAFCNARVNKSWTSPRTLRSAVLNTLSILLLSLFSMGLVALEMRALNLLGLSSEQRTVSISIPSKGQYYLEEIFPMEITIANIQTPINAIQADFSFDNEKLELLDISTQDSFANIFIQKEIDNEHGYGRITGGLPNPGYFGDRGHFARVYFKAKQPGVALINFLDSSLVLANNGQGNNIIKSLGGASYLILPDQIAKAKADEQQVELMPEVLGASVNRDETGQLLFYEQERQVLGETSDGEVGAESERGVTSSSWRNGSRLVIEKLAGAIIAFDQLIFSIWRL